MSLPPEILPFSGSWDEYENTIYGVYLETVVNGRLRFQGFPVKAQFRPETKGKGFSFWHLISEAPEQNNRNEDDRIPDLNRCERIRWVAWCIRNAENEGFSWWENQRGRDTHVVIWAEHHDFAVVLAKRHPHESGRYYLLKTAYNLRSHTVKKFTKERDAYWAALKG